MIKKNNKDFLIMIPNETLVRRYFILGERRLSHYFWSIIISVGSLGFLLTGLSSYLGFNLFPFIQAQEISFFPQGLLMLFYGSLGFLLSFYWWLLIFWNVGAGFNEFNKKEGFIRIFRWGYPGLQRRIDRLFPLTDLEALRVELKERTIYIQMKGKREIPISGTGQALDLRETEAQLSELSRFLSVELLL